VRVPADANVWLDGVATSQRGTVREFYSPVLEPGKRYTYQVRARWMKNGRPVTRTRTVRVRANAWSDVDFLGRR
jgi:uncharacterized protein (TIGR03000 family)